MKLSTTQTHQTNPRSLRALAGIYLRGIAMGAADIVPGVSGGTVAFITGIYEELLRSVGAINFTAVTVLLRQGPASFWRHVNGNFLLALVVGIFTSAILFATIISYLLTHHSLLVWSFFFGLIVASSIYMSRQLDEYNWKVLLAIVIGAVTAFVVTQIKPSQVHPGPLLIFLSGCLAICAMILPGISGSFILVLLGMYGHILVAIKEFQWFLLLTFAAGCAVGLMGFSFILTWLFKRFHTLTLAVLTGFLIGSLNLIWPWKQTLSYYQNSKGISLALEQKNILPSTYSSLVGPADTLFAIVLMITGVFLVLALEKAGVKNSVQRKKTGKNQ